MSKWTLQLERDYELPAVIVWDALVDAELVVGWLGEASISVELGGRYDIRWLHRPLGPLSRGRVTSLEPGRHLGVTSATTGRFVFDLTEFAGGSRGTSTRLDFSLEVEIEPAFSSTLTADWLTNLDQLEDLLRGHPVDWENWERDRQPDWSRHLQQIASSTAQAPRR